ncbi:MAG: glycosyltransferase [Armatimonas sp.]
MSRISVIIPAYNAASYLERTVRSVLSQTRPPDEILIVDDGSTDDTPRVATSFGPNVRYIRQENAYVGPARNNGFRNTTGEYVLFLDADDLLLPEHLETLLQALESHPEAGLAYCRSQTIDSDDNVVEPLWDKEDFEGDVWKSLVTGNFVRSPGCALFRRTALEKAGPWESNKRMRGNEDWDMLLRVAETAPFVRVERALFQYRVHSTNMSGDAVKMHVGAIWVLRKHLRRNWNNPMRRAWVWQVHHGFTVYTTTILLGEQARTAALSGDAARAASLLWRGTRYRPRTLLLSGTLTSGQLRTRHVVFWGAFNSLGLTTLYRNFPLEQRMALRRILRIRDPLPLPEIVPFDTPPALQPAPNTAPRVSVVIPTYNHAAFVLKTLDSVFAQTFTDFEIIVVNDGSPDNTEELLKPLAEAGKLTLITQPNAGQGSARNRGIAAARGEFVALLDDDDLWPADKLAWQVAALEKNPQAAVVYGFPDPIDDSDQPVEPKDWYGNLLPWPWQAPSGNLWRVLCDRCWLVSPGQAVVRKSALDTLEGPFDTSLKGTDDWDLWIRLAAYWEILFEERAALRYRLHMGNASQDTLKMRMACLAFYDRQLERWKDNSERHLCLAQCRDAFVRATPEYLASQVFIDRARGSGQLALRKLSYIARHRPGLLLHNRLWRFYLITLMRSRRADNAALDQAWAEQHGAGLP